MLEQGYNTLCPVTFGCFCMPSAMDGLTTHLVLLNGGTGLRHGRWGAIGAADLVLPVGQPPISVAAKISGPLVHKEACKAAVAQHARCLLSPEAMVELVLNMWSPKNGFRQISRLISLQQLRYPSTVTQFDPDYYIRHLCTRNAFDLKWK